MRILVVEDHPGLAQGIVTALQQVGYSVDLATDGEMADACLRADKFDTMLLDLNLPGLDGLEVLRRIRARGDELPVLILTARSDLDDRIRGLDLGADDYLAKPFELVELEARVRALLRRRADNKIARIECAGLQFDTIRRSCHINGQLENLPRRELSLLEALLHKKGQLISKDRLASQISNFDDAVTPNAVELYVSRLRRRLAPSGVTIKTIRGLGYLLDTK